MNFKKFKIDYTLVESLDPIEYQKAIKQNTKMIYVETPSNPLLEIIDLKKLQILLKKINSYQWLTTLFASPVNQTPSDLGIDLIVHSATKYLGGHSDILAGVVVSNEKE